MRQSIAAVALIRREHEGRTLWLAQWNSHWRCYNFISGHRLPDETFRECLVREIAEELDLYEGADYVVPNVPLTHLEYTAWSESAQAETQYTMALFKVELANDAARQKVDADPRNRWLSALEIHARQRDNGQPISPTMELLMSKVEGSF